MNNACSKGGIPLHSDLCTYNQQPDTPQSDITPNQLSIKSPLMPASLPVPSLPTSSPTIHSIAACINQRWHTQLMSTDNSITAQVLAQWSKTSQSITDIEDGQALEYCQLLHHLKFKKSWNLFVVNEFGCLAQQLKRCIKGTNTIKFIHELEISNDWCKEVTYIHFVCILCTKKN